MYITNLGEKVGKSIFAPEQARFLLKKGGSIIDIKPDKRIDYTPIVNIINEEIDDYKLAEYITIRLIEETNLLEKTIFIFKNSDTLVEGMTEWKNKI